MTALILLSHGSRNPKAAATVRELRQAVAERMGIPCFEAHLDFSAPDLGAVARRLVAEGIEDAVVVPLLFSSAYHHKVDVPREVAATQSATGLRLVLADALGTDLLVARVLAEKVAAEAPAGSHIALYSVGSSDEAANEQVMGLARTLATTLGRGVTSVQATGANKSSLLEVAIMHPRVHVLPLFVTHGLLLDAATSSISKIQDATGSVITHSAPLGAALAPVVGRRAAAMLCASC